MNAIAAVQAERSLTSACEYIVQFELTKAGCTPEYARANAYRFARRVPFDTVGNVDQAELAKLVEEIVDDVPLADMARKRSTATASRG